MTAQAQPELTIENLPGVARGATQKAILDALLSPEGALLSEFDYSRTQTRKWGSAGFKAFAGMRPRLEAALSGTPWELVQLPLGPRGGLRWAIRPRVEVEGQLALDFGEVE